MALSTFFFTVTGSDYARETCQMKCHLALDTFPFNSQLSAIGLKHHVVGVVSVCKSNLISLCGSFFSYPFFSHP